MEKASPRVNLRFLEPWTRDMFALGFVKPTELCRGLPRTSLTFSRPVRIDKREAFDESCVQHKCCALAYVPLTKWQEMEAWWCEPIGLMKGKPWVLKTLWRIDQGIVWLGFWAPCSCIHVARCWWPILKAWWYALPYMSLIMGDKYWSHDGNTLLRVCHSSWASYTGDLAECLCAHASGGTYWRLSQWRHGGVNYWDLWRANLGF